jgi:electron transfer flavoprotein beta subunit
MRVLTVIKQVPDSNAVIKVLPDGSGIETAGLKLILNPFDEFAVELALQQREARSDVEDIAVMTLGPDKAAEAMRTALAMGADRGIHVNDPSLESHNEIFQAEVLAAAIRRCDPPPDLVITGKQAIDMDCAELGPALAEFLGWPHVAVVTGFELAADGKSFKARRRIEGAEESMECPLPAVLTIEKGLVEPRYPSLPNLMKAKRKPVETLKAGDLPGFEGSHRDTTAVAGMSGPPPREACRLIEGEPPEMARELVRLLREEAKVI